MISSNDGLLCQQPTAVDYQYQWWWRLQIGGCNVDKYYIVLTVNKYSSIVDCSIIGADRCGLLLWLMMLMRSMMTSSSLSLQLKSTVIHRRSSHTKHNPHTHTHTHISICSANYLHTTTRRHCSKSCTIRCSQNFTQLTSAAVTSALAKNVTFCYVLLQACNC